MTTEQVRRAHQAAPFKPFTIHLADGRTFTVHHPELMMLSPGGRTVVLAVSDEAFEIIDLLLVTSLTTGNGSQEG
jgi:hypothetical protein